VGVGTYTVAANTDAFSIDPPYSILMNSMTYDNQKLASGTVVITKTDDIYTIIVDVVTEPKPDEETGTVVKSTYTGTLITE
jgi:hypothetical protein